MKKLILFCSVLFLIGCDAVQKADGYVVDKQTKMPIDSVAIGKQEKEDPNNSFTQREYTDNHGLFHYHSIGMTNDVELYFTKSGYATIKIEYTSTHRPDTVYMEKNGNN